MLEKVKAVRLREGVQPILTLIEARILDLIGDVAESAQLYRELLPVVDKDPEVSIRLAIALERRGRYADASEAIADVAISDSRLDSISSMAVAKLRHRLGLDQVLEFALNALQKGRDEPEIQLAYVWTILCREQIDKPLLEPEIVDAGTVLELENESSKRTITIVSDDASHSPPDVIRVSSPLGRLLCGKRAGDIVQISGLSLPYRIAAIKSRYVHEHQRIYLDFGLTFPGNSSLRPVSITDDSTPSVAQELHRKSIFVDKVLVQYGRGEIPVARFAAALGTTSINVLLSLASTKNQKILVSDGHGTEQLETVYTLSRESRVILDLSAIFTMAYLGLLENLTGVFEEVIVAQTAVDEVLDAISKENFGPLRYSYAGLSQSGISLASGECFDTHLRAILKAIERFVFTRCTILPAPLLLELAPGKLLQSWDMFTQAAMGSQALAFELQLPLWVDDLNWRRICAIKSATFWSQPALQYMTEKGVLSRDQYYLAETTLARAGYSIMRLNPDVFMWRVRSKTIR